MRKTVIFAVLAAAAVAASPALAQPRLLGAAPASGARVADARAIVLTFSERLNPAQSGFDLVMTAMPGMSHHDPMKITGFALAVGPDGKTLQSTLPRALPAGTYQLDWHATGADGQTARGRITFSVR